MLSQATRHLINRKKGFVSWKYITAS